MTLTLFLISFVGGPALFWLLARQHPGTSYFAALVIGAVLLAAGARLLPLLVPPSQASAGASVFMLWLGWIMVLALCALAIRARTEGGTLPRIAFAACAMATTLPWFGLHVASMLGD